MKKVKTLTISVLCMVLVLLLTGCGTKEPITSDDFKTKMEDKGYEVINPMHFTEYIPEIEMVYTAQNKDKSYEITYYQIDNDDNAKEIYNGIKNDYEKLKSGTVVETNVDLKNNNKYTLQNDGQYKVVSRIDNTIIFLDVTDSHKKEVKDILNYLGY